MKGSRATVASSSARRKGNASSLKGDLGKFGNSNGRKKKAVGIKKGGYSHEKRGRRR